MQSQYYSQTKASIHVTVLHRQAIKDVDGVDSTLEEPVVVTEHIFVISPDTKHDHHSVHQVRKLVAEYLEDIKYDVEVMDEWTDGCSAQYKSRHCMGDSSFSNSDFGYRMIRNYFETSHAKGPQDGAGANLRHKADIAVIKGQEVIQKAEDIYNFAQNNPKTLSPSRYQSEYVQLKRRIFFFVEKVNPDPGEEYYLLKITGNGPEHLRKRVKVDWGMCFPPGAEVVRGHFLIRRQEDPSLHSYCIEKGKLAVVYAATARYICPELESQISNDREIIDPSEQLHLDILESLNGF